MSFVDAFENSVLDEILGAAASLLGSPIQVRLSTTTPADDGTNFTEPSGFGYPAGGVSVDNDGVEWGAAASGVKSNLNTIAFPAASGGSWGVITHWGIFDGGTIKIWGVLDDGAGTPVTRTVLDGDTFRFLAAGLRIVLD